MQAEGGSGHRRWPRVLLRAASAAVLVGLLVLLGQRVEWAKVGLALKHAEISLVLCAAVLNFLNLACKTARWRTMLAPIRIVAFFRLYYYLVVSYAASALLPARAGELVRVYLLKRRDGVPVADSVGVVLVEKLFELLGLLAVVAPLPLLLALPRWAELSITIFAIGGLVALVAAVLLAGRLSRGSGKWRELARGLSCMRSPSAVAQAIAFSILAYLIDAAEMLLVLRALSIDVHWATPALALLGGNLAIAIPSTPGQLGALEAGVVAGLSIAGVPVASALAFALVYHVMQLLPIILAGLPGLRYVAEARAPGARSEPIIEGAS